jgi:hypothetical protein
VPEIRQDFDALEANSGRSETVKEGSPAEKQDFMDTCFRRALDATGRGLPACARSDLAVTRLPRHVAAERRAGKAGMPC